MLGMLGSTELSLEIRHTKESLSQILSDGVIKILTHKVNSVMRGHAVWLKQSLTKQNSHVLKSIEIYMELLHPSFLLALWV